MKVKILGWEYENIRRMEKLTVRLEHPKKEDVYHTSLIMMANGTGKTTTLYLIRAILSGNAEQWGSEEVRSYRPAGSDVSEGKFVLFMQFDEDIYYFVLHLDYLEGTAWYETSNAMMEGGYERGRRLPLEWRGIFRSEEFVNRFVFDGEQARKTLNSKSREAENAILYLYQLDKLDRLSDLIDRLVKRYQDQNGGGASARSVQIYRKKAEKSEQKYLALKKDALEIQRRLERMEGKRKEQEKKYQDILAQDNQMKEEQEELLKEREKNKRAEEQAVNQLMNCIRRPYELLLDYHNRLKTLAGNMQTLKLPKNTAREFFRELADSEICLCGRHIGKKEREHILAAAEEYLGEESLIVVNTIKKALNEYEREDHGPKLEQRLKSLLEEETKLEHNMNQLAVQMAGKGNQEILLIQEEIQRLNAEIAGAKKALELLTTEDDDNISGLNEDNNIGKAEEAMRTAQKNFLKASGTYEFTLKAQKMKQYIFQVKENTLNRLKTYIVTETNRRVESLIGNDRVIIKSIDGHLVLDGKKGVSEGQTLAVAYAYIGTLFQHSYYEFPFVVDSPAAPMDLDARREVAGILPDLFDQTIIFVTSGEKQGFAETFYPRDDVQYLTIIGKKHQPAKLVEGRPFFEMYQEAAETEG